MSEFPPPNIGPDGGGTPLPPPWAATPPAVPADVPPVASPFAVQGPPPGPTTPPPVGPAPAGSNRGKVIGGLVVVAALVGGGIWFATRSDDKAASSADTTEAPPLTTATTVAPATTTTEAPTTTEAVTTTTEAPTTTEAVTTTTAPFAVPPGAIDLGHEVYVPIPAGWQQISNPGEVVVLSDGTTSASFQSLARDQGEDIAALMQEYTNTFDTDFGAVGFGPTRFATQIAGALPVNEYITYYTTYDPGNLNGLSGAIFAYQRSDGLSVIYDLYSSDAGSPLPKDASDALVGSLTNAAALSPGAALTQHDPFKVTSVTPFVEVEGLIGFSTPPGFTTVTAGGAHGYATNGSEDFEVIKTPAQSDTAAVIGAAQTYLSQNYADVTYTPQTEDAADQYGVTHGTFTWTGTYSDGTPSAGRIDYYFDPSTTNGYVIYRNWFTTNGPDEPFAAEGAFMKRSFYSSITNIP